MRIFLGIILVLIFFVTTMVGSIFNGLIKHPYFPLDHYFSLEKITLNIVFAIAFTGIFVFLTPVFKDLSLLKKLIVRLGVVNFLFCCLVPFLIYSLSLQTTTQIIYNYYSWAILVIGLVVLAIAIYINKMKSNSN